MAPQPKTYGTRRSHAKPVGELVNGTTADEPEPRWERSDVKSTRMVTTKEDHSTKRKEEREEEPSQVLEKKDESASIIPVGDRVAGPHTPNVEDEPSTVSPALGSLKKGTISAPNILPPDQSKKELDSRRNSTRRSINRPTTSENERNVPSVGLESIPVVHTFPSDAGAISCPNGMTEDNQQSLVGHGIDLRDSPNNLRDIAIWVARLIKKLSDKSLLPSIAEPKQKAPSPQYGAITDTNDSLDNVEYGRMTRGREKKRLEQLKGKDLAKGMSLSLSILCIAPVVAPYSTHSLVNLAADAMDSNCRVWEHVCRWTREIFGAKRCSTSGEAQTKIVWTFNLNRYV